VPLWQDFPNSPVLKSCHYGNTFLVMKSFHYGKTLVW